jgi:hypothetical protein
MERPRFTDKKLICVDCGHEFVWSGSERFYFWSRALATPKRCQPCRERRKATIAPPEVRDG